jgi:hypothetical protein
VRDVATATAAAISTPARGHHRLLLAAPDIASPRPTLEEVRRWLPNVPWRGGLEFESDPYRSLIDTGNA